MSAAVDEVKVRYEAAAARAAKFGKSSEPWTEEMRGRFILSGQIVGHVRSFVAKIILEGGTEEIAYKKMEACVVLECGLDNLVYTNKQLSILAMAMNRAPVVLTEA